MWNMPIMMVFKIIALTYELNGKRCMGHRERKAVADQLQLLELQVKEKS